MLLEIRHNLFFAAGLLGRVPEDLDTGVLLQECGFSLVLVRVGTSSVRNYEQFGPRIYATKLLEFVLTLLA